ncbi:PLC-C group protein Nfis5 [Mycena pura]|uniref:PLC-C group protein Nfis5 n=1 Tax=Mycena pura TaxID=153505 RepID=A0AAD6UQF6_9AGAR|nr:PLC-C group protein Nfis5 [Mycena pura]
MITATGTPTRCTRWGTSYGQVFVKHSIYDADSAVVERWLHDYVASPNAVRPDDKAYTEAALDGETCTPSASTAPAAACRTSPGPISPFVPLASSKLSGRPPASPGYPLLWDIEVLTPRAQDAGAGFFLTPPKPFPNALNYNCPHGA